MATYSRLVRFLCDSCARVRAARASLNLLSLPFTSTSHAAFVARRPCVMAGQDNGGHESLLPKFQNFTLRERPPTMHHSGHHSPQTPQQSSSRPAELPPERADFYPESPTPPPPPRYELRSRRLGPGSGQHDVSPRSSRQGVARSAPRGGQSGRSRPSAIERHHREGSRRNAMAPGAPLPPLPPRTPRLRPKRHDTLQLPTSDLFEEDPAHSGVANRDEEVVDARAGNLFRRLGKGMALTTYGPVPDLPGSKEPLPRRRTYVAAISCGHLLIGLTLVTC